MYHNCTLAKFIITLIPYDEKQASLEKKTTRAIKSPCPVGCVGFLALAELLISFYI